MGDEIIGFVKIFAANWAPKNWKFCDGEVLNVSDYPALFKVIGKIYGGDGVKTFALPDLRSRVPINNLSSPVGPAFYMGQTGGAESVDLVLDQIPSHNHAFLVSSELASQPSPTNNVVAAPNDFSGRSGENTNGFSNGSPDTQLANRSINDEGMGQAHNNMAPFIAMNYIICVNGVFLPPTN